MATAITYAQALGTQRLHAMSGLRAQGMTQEDFIATIVPNLQYACDQLAPLGITLLVEPINTRDMPGYQLSLQADAHDLLARVARPNLKVQDGCDNRRIIELEIGEDGSNFERMGKIRITRSTLLRAMRFHGVDIGTVQKILVRLRIISPHAIDEFILPHHLIHVRRDATHSQVQINQHTIDHQPHQ